MGYFKNLALAAMGIGPDYYEGLLNLSIPPADRSLGQWDDLMVALNASKISARCGMSTITEVRQAFKVCSPLSSIVSQKAFAFVKGEVVVWNPKTKKGTRGQFKEWDDLFLKPNPFQSKRQFLTQAYSYLQTYGYCVIDPEYPAGFYDRPKSMRIIPNWLIEWEYSTSGYNRKPTAAYFTIEGRREPLDIERLVIIRDTASFDFDESTWLPLSRAAVLEAEIGNIIAALEARGQMITDRGANGLVSNTAKDAAGIQPMKASEKDRLQNEWNRRNGGIMIGQSKLVFTDASLGYTPMTFDVNELGLHPEHIADVKAICNRYCFPFTMLAEGYEGKYNNSSNGRRDFQDTTIDPESMDFFEQLSRGLGMYEQNCEAYIDYSGVASVQLSQQERGAGLSSMNSGLQIAWDAGLITRNEWREQIGEEPVEGNDDEFEKYKFETASAIAAQEQINSDAKANQEADNG